MKTENILYNLKLSMCEPTAGPGTPCMFPITWLIYQQPEQIVQKAITHFLSTLSYTMDLTTS